MKNLKITFLMILVLSFLSFSKKYVKKQEKTKVQVALLLDTSGSMQGLIEQAKTQLWQMVNELSLTKKNGISPEIEISLYEYGNLGLEASNDFIRQITPFTRDLDLVSEKLFELATNGGDEYCGSVINKAIKELEWTTNENALKIIFIAGNEPFTQGNILYKNACKEAVLKDIIINTIFCGNYDEGVNSKWKDGADLGEGKYLHIDHNIKTVNIESPYDEKLLNLNEVLNTTYVAYGYRGRELKKRQHKQDEKAEEISDANKVERVLTKSSLSYVNADWDLIDAFEDDSEILGNLDKKNLPEELKSISKDDLEKYVVSKSKERKKINKDIQKLNIERRKYILNKRKEMAETNTLDNAIISTILKQAGEKGLVQ